MSTVVAVYCFAACTIGAGIAGYFGYVTGIARGRDEQRVADIQEFWRAMPDRDSRGRFSRRCSLTCTRNDCGDTAKQETMT